MATPTANFTFSKNPGSLEVSFQNLSTNGPVEFLWTFGDGETSTEENPTHSFPFSTFFNVTLQVSNGDGQSTITKTVGVSEVGDTLNVPLVDLISSDIPTNISYSTSELDTFISKWQLHLAPLVNREFNYAEIHNEFYWEPLENHLIAKLVTHDMVIKAINTFILSSAGTGTSNTDGGIKSIETGPTKVEFQGSSENSTSIEKLMKPGGAMDELRQSICLLAKRLNIYLPDFCTPFRKTTPPKNYKK